MLVFSVRVTSAGAGGRATLRFTHLVCVEEVLNNRIRVRLARVHFDGCGHASALQGIRKVEGAYGWNRVVGAAV